MTLEDLSKQIHAMRVDLAQHIVDSKLAELEAKERQER